MTNEEKDEAMEMLQTIPTNMRVGRIILFDIKDGWGKIEDTLSKTRYSFNYLDYHGDYTDIVGDLVIFDADEHNLHAKNVRIVE